SFRRNLMAAIFHRLALEEMQRSFRWYRRRSPAAAQRFLDAISATVQRIMEGPDRLPIADAKHPQFRWAKLRRFPFLLYYRILDCTAVFVVAVAHGRRRFGYWLRRRLGS